MGQGRTQRGRRVRAIARSVAVIATLGVFYAVAAYAHTSGAPRAQASGKLLVSMSGAGGLGADASGLAAGDVVARTATLDSRGGPIQAIALTVSVSQSSLLDRDPQSGLRIRLDRCSTAWTARSPGASPSCGGRQTEVVGWRPLAANGSPWQLGGLASGATEWLRVTLQLPPGAPAQLGGRRSTVAYRFTAQ